jgi:hypothetical protein
MDWADKEEFELSEAPAPLVAWKHLKICAGHVRHGKGHP